MKKIFSVIILISILFVQANAQKKGNPNEVRRQNSSLALALKPDLTFTALPPTVGGGYGYEKVASVPGRIIMPLLFGVRNIGNRISGQYRIQATMLYQGIRTREEIEQGMSAEAYNRSIISEPAYMPSLDKAKDSIVNHPFTFGRMPEEIWGKRVKIFVQILYYPSTGEISSNNNTSLEYPFDLERY